MGFLKDLFKELFEVNHLMLDLIDKVEDTDIGDDLLCNFYLEKLLAEFSKEDLIKYKEEAGYSVLNNLSEEEFNEFLEETF